MKKIGLLAALAVGTAAFAAPAGAAGLLDAVKAKGFVQCGVSTGVAGFSAPDTAGNWVGLDVDYCRAIAAAIFGDAGKAKFRALSSKERLPAIQSGEVDVLTRTTTWTISRDTALGLNFRTINYYDGQGFMVRKALGVKSALELSGAAVCVATGTTTELNLADWFRANNLKYNPVVFEKIEDANAAYDAGRCDVYTTDQSGLYSVRLGLTKPDDHMVLPEVISKEPDGPVVRQGDDQWFDLVTWVHFAMVQAEEYGITKANVDEIKATTKNPEIRRFLGAEADSKIGIDLGVTNDWAFNIVKQVGNYGESFERNLGSGSPMKIARGLNNLWNKGGLQYAPPIR